MTLSVLKFGEQYGIWDADIKGFIYGPAPQPECFDRKRIAEDEVRLQQDNEFKEALIARYIEQFENAGMTREVAEAHLRKLMPNLYQTSTVDDKGLLF